MRVLIVSSEFPPGPGGIGTHAFQLALNLHNLGRHVQVLTSQDWVEDGEAEGFNSSAPFAIKAFRRFPTPFLKAAHRYANVRTACAEFAPDVIVATGQKSVWIVATALIGSSRPWIAVGHGSEFGVTRRWERNLVSRGFGQAQHVVCVSEFTRKEMIRCGVRARSSSVIPNGADNAVFQVLPRRDVLNCRQRMGLPSGRILLTVGNVTDRKGQEVVIRAMPRILQRCPNTHYVMVGLPTEREKLTRLAAVLGVTDNIHFMGRAETRTVVELMNACDLFLMTSCRTKTGDFEGYGIAAIEAALCGATAIVTAESGLSEAVIHNQTGLCTAEGDSEALASAVSSLLVDEGRRAELAQIARMRAEREHTWTKIVARYDAELQAVAACAIRSTNGMSA